MWERAFIERDLEHAAEKFRLMTENSPDVFWMATPGIRNTFYVSPSYERIWGQNPKRLYCSPKAFIEAIHPEERDVVRRGIKHHARGIWDFEYRIVCPDGSIRWISDRGFPILDEKGKIFRMCGVATDITRSMERYESMRRDRDEFKALVENRNTKLRAIKERLCREVKERRRLENVLSKLIVALEAFRSNRDSFIFPDSEALLMPNGEGGRERNAYRDGYEMLSRREREVFRLLADGDSIKVVATRLRISPKTVETHKYNIMDKLGVHKMSELTKIAIRNRVISD